MFGTFEGNTAQEGFVEGLSGGKTAVPAQHDDLVVFERIGDLVRHLRRARGKLLGHHRHLLEQVGGLVVNRHQLVARERKSDGSARVAVADRQGGGA